jgi:hypothetical protein
MLTGSSIKHTAKSTKSVCKVRGVTLYYSVSQLVKFDVIKDMILNKRTDEVVTIHTDRKINRTRKEGRVQILSEAGDKIYSVSFLREVDYTITIRFRSGILPSCPEVKIDGKGR